MLFNVPQFIDMEDKIIGPLTAKQLGWLAGGGVLLFVLWNMLDKSAFIVAAIIVGAIFGGLAFYRPYNQPLIKFILSAAYFTIRPKIYVWIRKYDNISIRKPKTTPKKEKVFQKKTIDNKRIKELTKVLDSQNQ